MTSASPCLSRNPLLPRIENTLHLLLRYETWTKLITTKLIHSSHHHHHHDHYYHYHHFKQQQKTKRLPYLVNPLKCFSQYENLFHWTKFCAYKKRKEKKTRNETPWVKQSWNLSSPFFFLWNSTINTAIFIKFEQIPNLSERFNGFLVIMRVFPIGIILKNWETAKWLRSSIVGTDFWFRCMLSNEELEE